MKKQKRGLFKRLSACILGAVMLGLLAVGAFAAPNTITVTAELYPFFNIQVNGASQVFYDALGRQAHPIVYNNTTYLPLRAIGELMGKNVNWDQSTLTVSIGGERTTANVAGTRDPNPQQKHVTAYFRPDFTIVLDGVVRTFTDTTGAVTYPLLYDGTTYLPLRAIGSLMGLEVGWDAATNTISLSTGQGGSLVTDADSFNQGSGTTTAPVTPPPAQTTQPNSGAMLSAETAKAKALAHAGLAANQVTFVQQKLEWENGRQVYDIEFYTADYTEYDYEIDAYTGAVLSFDYDAEHYSRPASGNNSSGSYIGEEKVRSIVLGKVPGATANHIVKLKLDYDDGRWEYEGEIRYNGWEYEFEVDAYTGTILSWEVDR